MIVIKDRQYSETDLLRGCPVKWRSKVCCKDKTYVKSGTPWFIDNEARFLKKVGDGVHFPKLLASGGTQDEHWIEMSAIEGEEMFARAGGGLRAKTIPQYARDVLSLLETLYNQNIMHRDISRDNILVSRDGKVAIIDFGFAIDFRADTDYVTPALLKHCLAPEYMFSDFYNMAKMFENRWEKMPYVERFAKELKKIDWDHYRDTEFVEAQIAKAKEAMACELTTRDYIEFWLGKYNVRKYIRDPKRILKRFKISK